MTRLAVVGATGLVGTKMLETLDRKAIPFDELVLFSSAPVSYTHLRAHET